ncbi:M24 family metallopeptidase [Rhizobium sp.]
MQIPRATFAFPVADYLQRLQAVKSAMAERGLDTLVVTSGSNITYLTGYTARSSYVPQGLVISASEAEPAFILRKMDAPAALHQAFMRRDKIIAYPEALIGNPTKDGHDAIIDFLLEAGIAGRGVGLEIGTLSYPAVEKFKRRLTGIVDCTGVIAWMRMVKSDHEIAYMRQAAAISDAAILRAAEVLRPGVREADAMAEIVGALARGTDGNVGTWVPTPFLCATPRTGTSHITWTEDTLRADSQVNVEIAGVRHGYTAPLSRTYSLGAPSPRLLKTHDAQLAGLEAALGVIRAGNTCGDVAQAANRAVEAFGIANESRCGYPVGIDWAEPTSSLKEGDETVLRPNMTFHLHLGNWAIEEDFGYVISETVRVTETGVDVLTKAPRQLFRI